VSDFHLSVRWGIFLVAVSVRPPQASSAFAMFLTFRHVAPLRRGPSAILKQALPDMKPDKGEQQPHCSWNEPRHFVRPMWWQVTAPTRPFSYRHLEIQ
jgi:hypothetical protein